MFIAQFNKALKKSLEWSSVPAVVFCFAMYLEDFLDINEKFSDIFLNLGLLALAVFFVGIAKLLLEKKMKLIAFNISIFICGVILIIGLFLVLHLYLKL